MKLLQLLTAAATLCVGTHAFAATIYLRDTGGAAYSGNAVTTSEWDDGFIATGGSAGTNGAVNNTSALQVASLTSGVKYYSLIGIKDMFTLLPSTNLSGDQLTITSAKLHLYANASFPGSAGASVTVNRATTNWLSQAAGSNDDTLSGTFAKNSAPTVSWAGAAFGAGDYSAATSGSIVWTSTSNFDNSIDITSVVNAIYTSGVNYGFVLSSDATANLQARSTDQTNNITPVLEISYDYASVPEPTTVGVLMLSGLGLLARRRGK